MTRSLPRSRNYEDFLNFFQDYAIQALRNRDEEVSDALRRRQIPPSKIRPLDETYTIVLKLGSNLRLNPIKKQVLKQIEAAAYLIRDFQIGILGQRTGVFHLYEVEIQIERHIPYALTFESGKLLVQIPYWQASFLERYLPYQQLKTLWHRGEQFAKRSPVRRAWWLFDPIGEFRTNLRTMLLLAVQKQILGIDKFFTKFGLADTETQARVTDGEPKKRGFKEGAIAYLKTTVDEDKLGINLDLALKDRDDKSVARLLSLYKQNLADPGQMEELIDAGILSLQEYLCEEQSQVDIKMYGFVNVGNYHRIDVTLNLSAGYLKKYVELVPRKTDVKAVQFGFVNVYTIDDITVKPNFHGAMKLNVEAAALERALQELQLNN